jgi:hypothetical protein
MIEDLTLTEQSTEKFPNASVAAGDSRLAEAWKAIGEGGAHGCVSSPPYLNNFDYADATRLELYFWGEVTSWSQMCATVRSDMITATTQQSSVGSARAAEENLQVLGDVADQVAQITTRLTTERKSRKRGKEYDRVVPDYFAAIADVLRNLSGALRPGSPAVWLVGDSAPYGVYIDTPYLIGQIGQSVGLVPEKDVILRRRGNRWNKNATRHNVELSERLILLRRV